MPNESPRSTIKRDFGISCTNPFIDVGDDTGARTATYTIDVENFGQEEKTIDLSYEFITGSSDNWLVTGPDSKTVPAGSSLPTVFEIVANPITPPSEDSTCQIRVTATDGLYNTAQDLFTTMNSWETEIFCENTYEYIIPEQGANPGYYIEFTLNITNEGEVKDIIDLDWGPEEIRGDWDVHFYWSTGGELPYVGGDPTLQNTDSINPSRIGSHWRTVIARVSIPTGSVVNHNWKYHVEDITIEGISSGSVDAGRREDSTVLVRPLVSWLGVCVSDESSSYTNNLWSGTYPGHNVNPGMVTSYVIDVFNVGANNPISVSLDNPTSWTGTLNHDGQSGSIITIPQEDLPNIGGHVSVFLNVTAPIDALEGETAQMSVNIDDGVNIDNVIVTSHVTLKKKVVMIVYNGVNNESLGLNTEGGRLDIDGGLPLWPNLLELANTGSRYNNAIDIHLVGADPNYIGMITSSRSWTHGIWQVLGDYVGMNLETGLPICEGYTHDNVQVDTAFNSVKSSTPELRTAVVNAKYWIGEMMNDEDLDLAVSGLSHPHYIREPEAYLHGPPGSGRLPMDKKRAVLQPSDEWVFDAAINTMLYEDPDFLLIMNVESDNAGHRFGSECDPDAEEINPGADPENMRWIMHNLDEQTGRLFSQMKNRTGIDGISAYNETLITVSADHGMKTYHPPRGEYNFDPRKLMEENEIYQNTDYEFCMMQNTGFWIYNFTDNTTRDWTKQLFLSWTNETGTRVAWQVLNKTEMGEAISDMPPSQGQPFGLYNEATAEQMLSFPDLLVLMNPTFQTPIDYGTTYGFMDLIPNMPSHWPSFAEPGLVGGHLSYDTQAIPLILHGPYIKQEYTSDKTVEIIDIIPTICELNEWTGLTSGYFEDHEAEGTPLWDSFCSWTVDGTLGEWQPLDDPAISGSSSWKAQYYWASTSLVSWNITGLDTDDSLSLSTEIGGYLRPERSYTLRWLDWDIGILPREPDYVQYSDDVGIMVFVGNEAWNGSAVYTFEPFTFYFHGLEDAQIEWDMDDGTTLTSRTVDYAYQKSGFYYVTATAILPDGDVVYRQVVVYVTNRAPIPVMDIYQEALLEFSVAGTPGNTVVLEILEDGVVVQSAEQTRGKGTPLVDSIAIQVRPGREYALRLTHNGSGANPVEITLSAENTVECVENMVCFEVELNHQQHTALVIDLDQHLEATMESNRRVWFDASQSYDLDGEIMSYTWYLEDDTELAGMKIDQVFQETGEHSVWLYVFDDEDAYNSTYTAFNLSSLIRPPIIYPPLPPMPPGPGPYPVPIPPRPRPRPIVITIPADKLHIEYQWNNNGLWEIEETISYTTTLGDRNWSWTVPEDATNFQVRFRLVASSYFRIPGAAGSVYLNDIALEIT
ncbi:MAG: PKD domain-containing protein [Candidatus Thermoplasmatota archaeon]|nr:PKD domain-containing protein [Candidatus Thermoplasmatota archaeon]